MDLLIAIGFVTILLLLSVLLLLGYSGLFYIVRVSTGEPPIGQVKFAYKFVTGPYSSSVGPIFTEVCSLAPGEDTLGIYYDDPQKTPDAKCRSAIGCILKDKEGASELSDLLKKERFAFITLPHVPSCVKTTFPFTTQLSVVLAVSRVYSRLQRYVEERQLKAYPYVEVYAGATIHYFGPLSKHDEFLVPECSESTEPVKSSTAQAGTDGGE